jgi:hypothetical protein
VEQLEDGLELAALTIDAGLAKQLLDALRAEKHTADAARAVAQPEGAPA